MTTRQIAGLDIGNGQVKALVTMDSIGDDSVDIPSAVALMSQKNAHPTPDEEAVEKVLSDDFYNEMDLSFSTKIIGDHHRRLFGRRALSASGQLLQFDVKTPVSKAQQPVARSLVLGVLAGNALRDYVRAHGALPDQELQVQTVAAMALPIDEFITHRATYSELFEGEHLVIVQNFETRVHIRLHITKVVVLAEGASGQFAITSMGEPLAAGLLQDVRKRGMSLEGITSADIVAATNTICVDIGEGTSNLVAFTDGRFNPDSSMTFSKGFGTVLENALDAMRTSGVNSGFSSRKQLADFYVTPPSKLKAAQYTRVAGFIEEQAGFFARELVDHLSGILASVGANTEVLYVYGGGSGALRPALLPLLEAKVAESVTDAFPTLYLDVSYSRLLNRQGLHIAATKQAERIFR